MGQVLSQEAAMTEADKPVTETFSARLIRRDAERRAALELSTATPAGLESALAQISAEVTADAIEAKATPTVVATSCRPPADPP
jgi:hypothetical protein